MVQQAFENNLANLQSTLIRKLAPYRWDPLGFVERVFPWGTGELINSPGPRPWQRASCSPISASTFRILPHATSLRSTLCHPATVSANLTLVAMLTLWAMCQPDCKAVITAKTEVQLRTKTWPELAKWYRPALHKTWFNFGATSITSRDAKHERSCDATWCRGRKPIPKRLLACTTRETASYWCSMKPPPSSTWCGKWPKVLSPTNA